VSTITIIDEDTCLEEYSDLGYTVYCCLRRGHSHYHTAKYQKATISWPQENDLHKTTR
jgi:hypothetical protein